jgi:hypothetical protein
MLYVGIDLAERHSATVVINDAYQPVYENFIDSGLVAKKEHPWARFEKYRDYTAHLMTFLLAEPYTEGWHVRARLAIEEPYPHAVNVAPAYRMQGAVIAEMQDYKVPEKCVVITKSKPWQDYLGYTKAEFGNAKAWAKIMCEGFDYEPGALIEGRKVLAKPKEDLRDAYLMARWLKETSAS